MSKSKKIAVTCKDSSKIWSNGLTQNAYFLIKLLKKAGYEVDAVSQYSEAGTNLEEFEIKRLGVDNYKKYNVILEVCYSVSDDLLELIQKSGVKIATINYGNILMLMQEDMILKPESYPAVNRGGVETWISPHFEFSKGFVEATSKANVKICPYIWSSEIFDKFCKTRNINPFYSEDTPINKVGILESNINIIKTCIYPLISLEKLERKNPNLIKEILIFNAENIKENEKFKEIMHNFNIYKNKKMSAEYRFPFPLLLSNKNIGSVISHQFYNDLNYLTLESLYTKTPIVHNSEFCKDAGYFYNKFNADECISQIENMVENHKSKTVEYHNSAKELLFKFSADNYKNIKEYKNLIENM
jgi:hypothetical protein